MTTTDHDSKIELTLTQCRQLHRAGSMREVCDLLNNRPDFLRSEMGVDSIEEILNIAESGCASNAHASCWYSASAEFMSNFGDEVLEYIEERGVLSDVQLDNGIGWGEVSARFLQFAIESYCRHVESYITDDFDC